MHDLGHHIMIHSDDDRVLAPSDAARRALAEAVYRVAAPFPLLGFGAADNHLHLVVLCDRRQAARFAGRLLCALHWALDLPVAFFPVRYKRLADQYHLITAFHYCLGQRNKHAVQSDPYLDASSLPELLGLRLVPTDSITRVREQVARLGRDRLLGHLGAEHLEPASNDIITDLVVAGRGHLLRDAACGALGRPALVGRSAHVVRARNALVKVLSTCCTTPQIAELVGRSPSQVRHLRTLARQPQLERAVSLQIALRAWLLQQHPDLVSTTPTSLPMRLSADPQLQAPANQHP